MLRQARLALRAGNALGALCAGVALRARRSGVAFLPLNALDALGAGVALVTVRALDALGAGVALVALQALDALNPLRADLVPVDRRLALLAGLAGRKHPEQAVRGGSRGTPWASV